MLSYMLCNILFAFFVFWKQKRSSISNKWCFSDCDLQLMEGFFFFFLLRSPAEFCRCPATQKLRHFLRGFICCPYFLSIDQHNWSTQVAEITKEVLRDHSRLHKDLVSWLQTAKRRNNFFCCCCYEEMELRSRGFSCKCILCTFSVMEVLDIFKVFLKANEFVW